VPVIGSFVYLIQSNGTNGVKYIEARKVVGAKTYFVTVSVITVLAICVFERDTECSFNLCITFPAEAIT